MSIPFQWLLLSGFLFPAIPLIAQPVHEFMDLQTHPAMHMAYSFFGTGLEYFPEDQPPALSYKHLLTNVNYANYLENNQGARIIVNGAILPEVMVAKKKARSRILAQLKYVNDFADEHSDQFAVARSPKEVRHLVHHSNKTIIIHSIEGGKRLLDGPEDARFWAEQGVAFITLIHLMDDEFGGAATAPSMETKLINAPGAFNNTFHKKRGRGLTDKGKQAIQWLADAGIMTDLTHMSDESRSDALDYMEAHGIPALVTHDMFKPIQNQPRGITEEDVLRIYQGGGLMSLPVSGASTLPHEPSEKYQKMLDSLERYCPGSIDSYKFTYQALQQYVEGPVTETVLDQELHFSDLAESEKIDFAIGFQSDFNGWLNHHRPRYGEEGCFEMEEGKTYEAIETEGMAHPGLLESHWNLLRKEGVDLEPVLRASEKFLQMWEYFLDQRKEIE
jgi:microsomal dipeptidase-like Zn-dependent dipeptidase